MLSASFTNDFRVDAFIIRCWEARVYPQESTDLRLFSAGTFGEYSLIVRQHLDRLKNLIFPLLEQNLSREDEHAIGDKLNTMPIEESLDGDTGPYLKLIETLEEELADWD